MTDVVTLADGYEFPESPEVGPDGDLYLVDVRAEAVAVVGRHGTTRRIPTGMGSRPNGCGFLPDSRLVVCDSGLNRVRVLDPATGSWADLGTTWHVDEAYPLCDVSRFAPDLAAAGFQGPNDVTIIPGGEMFFTDPVGSTIDRPVGCVYHRDRAGTVTRIATGIAYPNGLLLSVDQTTLYVAETRRRRLLALHLDTGRRVRGHEVFCQLPPGGHGPDGICYDQHGNLVVAYYGAGSVVVVSGDGEITRTVELSAANPTNVCLLADSHGLAGHHIVVTEAETGSVYAIRHDA